MLYLLIPLLFTIQALTPLYHHYHLRDITRRNLKLDGRRLYRSDLVGIVDGFKDAGIVVLEEGKRGSMKLRWTGQKLTT